MKPSASSAESGQTLLELLVVLAILGLLAAIAAPQMSRYGEIGKENALRTQLAAVAAALRLFRDDVGRFPTTTEGLNSLAREPADTAGWDGPYVSGNSSLLDPWGHTLNYRSAEQGTDFDLLSSHKPEWRRNSERLLTMSRGQAP